MGLCNSMDDYMTKYHIFNGIVGREGGFIDDNNDLVGVVGGGPEKDEMSYNKQAMTAELRRDEGVIPNAYQDSLGYWTIGVGRLIDKRKGGRLRDEEIDFLLLNDIAEKEEELDAAIPWWRTLSDARQRVLLSMCFNLGIKGLLGFQNTLAMIKVGNYAGASAGMLDSKWAKQVGSRATRLSEMMKEG